jgi:surfeit locus 1 family protein
LIEAAAGRPPKTPTDMISHFRPALVPTLVFLLLWPLLLYLGSWQLQRAEEKRELQAEYDARASDEPITLGGQRQRADDLRFHRVRARGVYETGNQVLLDNRVHHGQAGYHVITPLKIAGTEMRLLVNRGWIALGASRAQLPKIETPAGMQEITGVATVPAEQVFTLGPPEGSQSDWPPVWQHLDMSRYASLAPFAVQPVVVLLDPASPAGGLLREWSRLDAGIAVHQGYAFQWFTLAAALVGIYVYFGLRVGRRRKRTRPDEN